MKRIEMPQFDLQGLANDFKNLNPKDVGAWPLAPRVATLIGLFILILVLGWFLVCSEGIDNLELKQQEETKLRNDFLSKKKQAVNLDLYVQQLNEIDRSFGALLKQLPNRAEVESLLVEINQSGMGRGLQFELFKPGPEVVQDFYAELPINVKLTGSYHDFGAFAADIGRLSRIVTLNNLSIVPQKDGGGLTMDATARTYRYLDADEQAAQRKASAAQAKK